MKRYCTILSIAGSDSVGGAGIQADLKTATALGVYAMTAITAVTAQNTMGVRSWSSVEPELLRGQLDAVLDDVRPDAVKIGMLPDTDAVRIVADVIQTRDLSNVVLDPVCVATSGDALTTDSVPAEMMRRLFPLVTVITPNIPEAEMFLGHAVDVNDLTLSAKELLAKAGTNAVLLKGGHVESSAQSTDVLVTNYGTVEIMTMDRIETRNTHGTGCSLSSAIASFIAKGESLTEAIRHAKGWLHAAIAAGADYSLGHGCGPVNHLFKIHQ